MDPYNWESVFVRFSIYLALTSFIFHQIPLTGGEAPPLNDFMADHLRRTSPNRGGGGGGTGSAGRRNGQHPIPSHLQLRNMRQGEPNSLTPGEDRVFFPPYKFPYWGFPYGIYSKGGFFNPGLFPFVPGGPAFPPYDGIFGGPFGPGRFPGPGPTPFQGGSNSTRSGQDYQNNYYYPPEPPKRYKKKKKKPCTTTTTTTPAPPETTTAAPSPSPATYPAQDYPNYYMEDYRNYRGSPPRRYPPPSSYNNRYRTPTSYNPYQYSGYSPPPYEPSPPPAPNSYQNPYGHMPYPLIIQTSPYVMPPSQPQYIMSPPPPFNPYSGPNGHNPYGYPPNPYAQVPPGSPPATTTVQNFYPPNQPLPPFPYYSHQQMPYYPPYPYPYPSYPSMPDYPSPTTSSSSPEYSTTTTTTPQPVTTTTTTATYSTAPVPLTTVLPPSFSIPTASRPENTVPPPIYNQPYPVHAEQEAYGSYSYTTPSATTTPPSFKTFQTSYGNVKLNTESIPTPTTPAPPPPRSTYRPFYSPISPAEPNTSASPPPRYYANSDLSKRPGGETASTSLTMQTLVDISNPRPDIPASAGVIRWSNGERSDTTPPRTHSLIPLIDISESPISSPPPPQNPNVPGDEVYDEEYAVAAAAAGE